MPSYGPFTLPLGDEGWQDTGLDLPAGVVVHVTASGSGRWDDFYTAYPTGSPGWPTFPITGDPLGTGRIPFSLLLAVTNTPPGFGQPNTIQGSASFSFSSAGGRLYVGFNDLEGTFHDNTGFFQVTVEFEARADEEDAEMTTRFIDDVVTFWAQLSDATATATDATGDPAFQVYEEATNTPLLTGEMAKQDDANTVGLYQGQFTATSLDGFEVGKSYCVRASATVAGVGQARIVDRFVIRPSLATSVWAAPLPADQPGVPVTFEGALRRLLSKFVNRMSKSGNVVTLYAADHATPLATQGFSITDTGFDRAPDN